MTEAFSSESLSPAAQLVVDAINDGPEMRGGLEGGVLATRVRCGWLEVLIKVRTCDSW